LQVQVFFFFRSLRECAGEGIVGDDQFGVGFFAALDLADDAVVGLVPDAGEAGVELADVGITK